MILLGALLLPEVKNNDNNNNNNKTTLVNIYNNLYSPTQCGRQRNKNT